MTNKLCLFSSILGELEWIRLSKLQLLLLEPHSSILLEDCSRKESLTYCGVKKSSSMYRNVILQWNTSNEGMEEEKTQGSKQKSDF